MLDKAEGFADFIYSMGLPKNPEENLAISSRNFREVKHGRLRLFPA
jgi:hypothetical protein